MRTVLNALRLALRTVAAHERTGTARTRTTQPVVDLGPGTMPGHFWA